MKRIYYLVGGFCFLGLSIILFTSWDWLGGFVYGVGVGVLLGFALFGKKYIEAKKREVYVYKDKRNR